MCVLGLAPRAHRVSLDDAIGAVMLHKWKFIPKLIFIKL